MAMIRKVTLKNFKRFPEVVFDVPGHLVLAGPNNTGKTTLLQAIAAWSLGLQEWKKLGSPSKVNAGYAWADMERLAFSAAALRSFDLLWRNRQTTSPLEIGLQFDGQHAPITLEFRFQASGLVNVRPTSKVPSATLSQVSSLETVFIPAIGGLVRDEPMLADRVAIQARLAQARAGEVLRNLVVLVHQQDAEWKRLNATLQRMFGVVLLPPVRGADITCEYQEARSTAWKEPDQNDSLPVLFSGLMDQLGAFASFDLASAGSGMLQVLLVLALLLTHPGATLLIDEPDAHLHLILQKAIYGELRAVAAERGSQLIIATHSEQLIESVDPRELCLMFGSPRLVADSEERAILVRSLGVLTHGDLLLANGARGVVYAEDFTDFDILEAFARVLSDEVALRLLSAQIVKKRARAPAPEGLGEVEPSKHWGMLKLAGTDLPALELLDGDSKYKADDVVTGTAAKMQRLRWRYYEIESYLVSPEPWKRFLAAKIGNGAAAQLATEAAWAEMDKLLEASFRNHPLAPSGPQRRVLETEATSKTLIPAMLQAAGLNQFNKNSYFEIAQMFAPDEVHAEVRYKLAQLKAAFRVGPMPPPFQEFAADA